MADLKHGDPNTSAESIVVAVEKQKNIRHQIALIG
jgi:hypothetical protein